MPKINLKQPGFTHSGCGPFNRNKERIQKFIQTGTTNNEGKSVVAGRFIRALKNKTYKHMTAVSKNVYFDVNTIFTIYTISDGKYKNTYHRTIKMKPMNVKCNSYVECNVDSNAKDLKFKIVDYVRISN